MLGPAKGGVPRGACVPARFLPQGGMSVRVPTARITKPVLWVSNLDHV